MRISDWSSDVCSSDLDRKLGNCLACHANSDLSEQLFHGGVGPSLDGDGERWTPEQLRAIVVDSKAVFGEQTVMPGFYSLDVGVNVRKDLVGKTMLTAVQVEPHVASLATRTCTSRRSEESRVGKESVSKG